MTADPAERPPLDETRLGHLAPRLVVEVVDAAPSTNAVVAQRARAGAPEGLVVVAEHQTGGRGRLDRVWETPDRAALTFSLLLRPSVPAVDWPWLPLLTGYAVTRTLRAEGVGAGVKWPNDVLVGERKVAGILVERIDTPGGPAAVVGIGLNVSTTAEELPVTTATSLAIETGTASDRTHLLARLLTAVHDSYVAWQAGGPAGTVRLRDAYTAACVTLGHDVRVQLPSGESLVGPATGIDATGRLVVRGPAGDVAVGAGDVVHVRRVGQ